MKVYGIPVASWHLRFRDETSEDTLLQNFLGAMNMAEEFSPIFKLQSIQYTRSRVQVPAMFCLEVLYPNQFLRDFTKIQDASAVWRGFVIIAKRHRSLARNNDIYI